MNYNKFNNSNINIWVCHHMPFENEYENVNDINIINYLTTNDDENSYNSIQYFINEITCVTYPYLNNIRSNYIGFQHYRRKFDLSIFDLYKKIKKNDNLILYFYMAWFPNGKFVEQQIYDWKLTESLINDIRDFLKKENIDIYDIVKTNTLFPRCNIFFTSWKIYEMIARFDINFIQFISEKYNLGKDPIKWKQHIEKIYIYPNEGNKFGAPDYKNLYIDINGQLSYRIYGFILEFLNELYILYIGKAMYFEQYAKYIN